MLKKLKNNKIEILLGLFLTGLLILIRTYEDTIFYDPLLKYFRYDYTNMKLPAINSVKLFLSMGFRYYLNSMISLGILYLIFKDTKIVKFSTLLFIIFGSVLMISFLSGSFKTAFLIPDSFKTLINKSPKGIFLFKLIQPLNVE